MLQNDSGWLIRLPALQEFTKHSCFFDELTEIIND